MSADNVLEEVGRIHGRAANMVRFLSVSLVDGTHAIGGGRGSFTPPTDDPQACTVFLGPVAIANFTADERKEAQAFVDKLEKVLVSQRDQVLKDTQKKLKEQLK
jgi:hypothetical protein